MKENFFKTKFRDSELIYGQVKIKQNLNNTKVNGLIIKCTGREFLFGVMVEDMKVSLSKIRDVVKVSAFGQMEGSTKDNGKTANKMEKA
jgi:hypothetical protein